MSPRVLIMLLDAVLIAAGLFASETQVSAQSCGVNVSDLRSKCLKYVTKTGPQEPPSKGCCAAVMPADVPCVCRFLTDDIVDMIRGFISTKKAIFVARSCGKNLSSGTKCGSLAIPPL